jgi:cytochrome c oxidase cbb3-type subunit III
MSSGCRNVSGAAGLVLLLAVALAGCKREEREFRGSPVARDEAQEIAMVSIAAGPRPPERHPTGLGGNYERNAYHLSEGKKLYLWFNCNGCHANGGGDSGPPLMDEKWIYGGDIENIVATIREGRPNGMPSFRGRIPDDQIWQIAAFVRSMGRYVPKDAAPGRGDTLHARPAENRRPAAAPVPGGGVPPSADGTQ